MAVLSFDGSPDLVGRRAMSDYTARPPEIDCAFSPQSDEVHGMLRQRLAPPGLAITKFGMRESPSTRGTRQAVGGDWDNGFSNVRLNKSRKPIHGREADPGENGQNDNKPEESCHGRLCRLLCNSQE
jgi:hypothetical protein